ncbi:unnamed protein product, partial [Rotaria sordida]
TIGNVLVILTVVTVKQMRSTTNALILHLAIANLSFILKIHSKIILSCV